MLFRSVQFVRSALLAATSCLVLQVPARALEEVVVALPLLQTNLTLNLRELSSPEALINGSSDLAELDRASDGALGRKLLTLFNHPLPWSRPSCFCRHWAGLTAGLPI